MNEPYEVKYKGRTYKVTVEEKEDTFTYWTAEWRECRNYSYTSTRSELDALENLHRLDYKLSTNKIVYKITGEWEYFVIEKDINRKFYIAKAEFHPDDPMIILTIGSFKDCYKRIHGVIRRINILQSTYTEDKML